MLPHVIEGKNSNKERMYDVYSLLLNDRVVFINGKFNDEMANDVVAQLLYLSSSSNDEDITLYINSPGGNVSSMYMIYDTMVHIPNDVATIGMGAVSSAGTFILTAGKHGKRYALENCSLMIHELSSGIDGKYHEMKNRFEHTQLLYDKMANHYAEFTGQKLSKIKKDMKKDYYMTAEEALEYGLSLIHI